MNMKNTRQANKFMMIFLIYEFASQIIFMIMAAVLSLQGKSSSEIMQYLILSQDLVMFMIPMAVYIILTGIPLKEIVPLKKLSGKNVIYVILITLFALPISNVIASITSIFVSTEVNDSFYEIILDYPWWISFLFMVIMPVIFEEAMFRGFILTGYKRSGVMKAVFMSALYFGMMHLDLYQLPYAVFLGIIMAAFVYYTGSIYASMIAHFIVNGSQTVMLILAKLTMGKEELAESMAQTTTIEDRLAGLNSAVVVMVVALPFLLYFLSRFIRRNRANSIEYCTGFRAIEAYGLYDNPEKTNCFDVFFWITLVLYIGYMIMSKVVLK
jgi:hypothetical protein